MIRAVTEQPKDGQFVATWVFNGKVWSAQLEWYEGALCRNIDTEYAGNTDLVEDVVYQDDSFTLIEMGKGNWFDSFDVRSTCRLFLIHEEEED